MAELTFQNPEYLWYLVSIPLLMATHYYYLRYAKYRGMRFANFDTMKRVAGEEYFTKNYTLLFLRILILIFLIFAAAGTTYWYTGQSTQSDFVIALDVSASMTSQDIEPSRIDAAKEIINGLLDNLDERGITTRAGLLTFSGSTYIESPVTRDMVNIKRELAEVEVRREGGTDISGAVVTGVNMLVNSDRGKAIILVSDGSVTVGTTDDSLTNAIFYSQDERVVVHSIGLGTDAGPIGYLPEYYNATSVFREETLINLANATRGTFQRIEEGTNLESVFNTIGESSEEASIDVELSNILLLAGLLFIFLEWGLVSTKFRRLP